MEPPGRVPTKQRRRERILVEPQQPPAARASKPRGVASTKTLETTNPLQDLQRRCPQLGHDIRDAATARPVELEQGFSPEDQARRSKTAPPGRIAAPKASPPSARERARLSPRTPSRRDARAMEQGASEPSTSPAPGIGEACLARHMGPSGRCRRRPGCASCRTGGGCRHGPPP